MEFTFMAPTDHDVALVRRTIDRLHAARHPLAISRQLLKQPISVPHAVYDLRADEVAKGLGLARAHLAGTRYFVGDIRKPTAAAEIPSQVAKLATMNFGPFVRGTAAAIQKLQKAKAPQDGDFEIRLLRFAALGLMALWLRPSKSDRDYVYPIAPIPPHILGPKLYSEEEFIAALRPVAQRRLANDESSAAP